MPSNIEIKAALPNGIKNAEIIAKGLCRTGEDTPKYLQQFDTFFQTKTGRLKLREENGKAVLIAYSRTDALGPTRSDYLITPVAHPDSMTQVLSRAYGIRGVLNKQRTLYLIHWDKYPLVARVHLDIVKNLGSYIEFEVVLKDDDDPAKGEEMAEELIKAFGIKKEELIKNAYMDELELKRNKTPTIK